jgi:hypothetical protein
MFGRISISLALMCAAAAAADEYDDPAVRLARILAEKGSISKVELSIVESAAENARVGALASILQRKGLLNDTEVAQVWTRRGSPSDGAVQVVPVSAQAARAPATPQPPQPRRTADIPVTSQTHIPVILYGTVLFNAFYNTAANNIEDLPLFLSKQGSDPTGGDKNFGMTARQTRLGLRFNEPNVAGAKLSGQFEFDIFGGKTEFPVGMNMDLFRLRLAYGRLDWHHWAFEAGQDWAVFAPLNPTSFAMYAIPEFSSSGNLWIRQPQVRAEYTTGPSDTSHFLWQVAADDPNVGDYPPNLFSASRQPGIGERGRMPMMENRFAWTSRVDDRDFTVGASGVYGRGKNFGMIGSINVQQPVDSWGVALDYSLPFTRHFNLTGEAFVGRALGIFSGTNGESVGAVGTAGGHGVRSQGGWIQAQFNFARHWQVNLAYGIETPTATELPVGNRWRNQNYMGNLMYRLSNNLTFSWEYRRMLTDYRNQIFANERGDHVNLGVVFMF